MAQTARNQPGSQPTAEKKEKSSSNISSLQYKIEKNQKTIIGVVVALALVIGGFFGYKEFILKPKEEKAASALYPTQRWFEMDSLQLVLNGNGIQNGALDVIKKYGGTKAANLAHYYAGIAYLRSGDSENALAQLKKFDGKGTPLEYIAYGAMGDAYMEKNETAKGIELYKKAASNSADEYLAPLYLFRAGLASEVSGNTDEAKKLYREVKEKYPYSEQARNIDKYLARLGDISI